MNWIVKTGSIFQTGSISQTGSILQTGSISSKSISLMLLFISTIGCKKYDHETMVYINIFIFDRLGTWYNYSLKAVLFKK